MFLYSLICFVGLLCCFLFFFKQKTAYEMRISDWSSDVCSSDLLGQRNTQLGGAHRPSEGDHHFAIRIEVRFVTFGGIDQRSGIEMQEIGRASCRERVCQYV